MYLSEYAIIWNFATCAPNSNAVLKQLLSGVGASPDQVSFRASDRRHRLRISRLKGTMYRLGTNHSPYTGERLERLSKKGFALF